MTVTLFTVSAAISLVILKQALLLTVILFTTIFNTTILMRHYIVNIQVK